MLRDLAVLVSPVLALLLIVLTPVGTGSGVHRDQVLDPLFPHVHPGAPPMAGRAASVAPRVPGQALGAGGDAASLSLGTGLTPTNPTLLVHLPIGDATWSWPTLLDLAVGRIADPPPDPPPPNDRSSS
jgi:hypothetical protein